MTTPSPTIAVLIACHNRRPKTLACLDALAVQHGDAVLHPFVFDDGCSDGTGAAVRDAHPAVSVLQGDGTAFWAGGMRALFDHVLPRNFDHVLWLNDDVVLEPDAIVRLLDAERMLAARAEGCILIGGAVCDPDTGAFTYGGIVRRAPSLLPLRFIAVGPHAADLRPCDTLHGNVVLIPRRTVQAIGSIGRAYVHTLGDLDYGLRVRQQGGTVALAPGFFGRCEGNPRAHQWFDPATSLRTRWRKLKDPLGFPVRPWLHFARAHGGPLWPIHAFVPFWRLFAPPRLATTLAFMARLRVRPA